MKTIEIVAGMGVGKTTLANILCDKFNYKLVDEEFFKDNPFLKKFFEEGEFLGFETQACYLIQIYYQRKSLGEGNFVFDHSIMSNKAYAWSSIKNPVEMECYNQIYRTVTENTITPDLRLYLKCNPEEQHKRIRNRARDFEDSVTLEHITEMDNYVRDIFMRENGNVPFLEIDTTELDLVGNFNDINEVIDLLQSLGQNMKKQMP